MFCPLCKAEYREGFAVCSTCGADLVPSRADFWAHPQLNWITRDRGEFDRVVVQLREAGIPCSDHAEDDHWLLALAGRQPTFFVHVLEGDAQRAASAAGVEFRAPHEQPILQERIPMQTCPACGKEFRAGVAECPACRLDLLAWKAPEEQAQAGAPEEAPGGVAPDGDSPLELVWRGGDPVTHSRAVLALREAGIPHTTTLNFEHMVFELAVARPRSAIWAYERDAERARDLLRDHQDPFPLVASEPTTTVAQEEPGVEAGSAGMEAEMEARQEESLYLQQEYQARKRNLHWGAGLMLASMLLYVWVMRASASVFLRFGSANLYLIATGVLLLAAILSGLSSLWFLSRAWALRSDKIGLLACFFAFQLIVSLMVIVLSALS